MLIKMVNVINFSLVTMCQPCLGRSAFGDSVGDLRSDPRKLSRHGHSFASLEAGQGHYIFPRRSMVAQRQKGRAKILSVFE